MVRKTRKQYKTSKNGIVNKEDAQRVGEKIEQLLKANRGEITPSEVLSEAKKSTSILHKYFEWDDTTSAHNYRLWQARKLLGSIIEVIIIDKAEQPMRSFFNVTNSNAERVYVTLKDTISTPNYTVQVIEDCEKYITHFLSVMKILKKQVR